jgi:hypothetical protein
MDVLIFEILLRKKKIEKSKERKLNSMRHSEQQLIVPDSQLSGIHRQ